MGLLKCAAGASLLALACILPVRSLPAQGSDAERGALVAEAKLELDQGRPYRASRLLVPVLAGGTGRESSVVLLASRAAAGWGGWGTVVQLLSAEPWLDQVEQGQGRALLARARVERSEPAVEDARRALATAAREQVGPRLIILARAFDRADQLDSAAQAYRRAADAFPAAADWLRLRAAGVTRDSAERAALYGGVRLPAAIPRIPWTEALARSRTGDLAGAAILYASLGASVAALRLRLASAFSDSTRTPVRRDLVRLLGTSLPAEDARSAIALLDNSFAPLTAVEERAIARRAAALDPARAAAGFGRALAAQLLTDADRLAYGTVLARLGRHGQAIRVLGEVGAGDLRAKAEYQRARSVLATGDRTAAIGLLRRILAGQADSLTIATAGFFAADLLVDSGDEAGARKLYGEVGRRFPRTPHGPRAAFQAAMIAWAGGNRFEAEREFGALAERAGEHREGAAALYWSGRARAAAGDSAVARDRWNAVLQRFPGSYYALRAAERLGARPAPEPPPGIVALPDSNLGAALDRAALLDELGLRVESRFEYDQVSRLAEGSPGSRLTLANAFLERGLVGRAFRLAAPMAGAVARRFGFPLAEIPLLLEEARRAEVDPLLAAALIRQESGFELSARSPADARGWMQVMPSLGASLAHATGIREWDPGLLHQPEINLRFGLSHLAETLKRYPGLHLALATYNAGSRAAERWLGLPGAADDPEVFIERIQYAETRDYVRQILRNLAVYRAMYPELP